MNISLIFGNYFNLGKQYYMSAVGPQEEIKQLEFLLEHDEFFKSVIVSSFKNKDNLLTFSIPEENLKQFILKLVMNYERKLTINNKIIELSDLLNIEQEFEKLKTNIQVEQTNYGSGNYYFKFQYSNKEQQKEMFDIFDRILIPILGAASNRAQFGKRHIIPYLVDEKGVLSHENTGIVGGMNVPEDLLYLLIRFFAKNDMVVNFGNYKIKSDIVEEDFNTILENNKEEKVNMNL